MKIVKISGNNVKGKAHFSYKLGAVNMITGHPFSGKTAVRDALVFGLCGHLPWVGKLPRATAQIASNSPMSVEFWTDAHEHSFARTLTIKGEKCSVLDCDGLPETPTVLMNMSEFFGLGPTDKTNFIFSRVKISPDEFSPAALIDAVYRADIDKSSEHERNCLDEIGNTLKDHSDAYDMAAENNQANPIQDWIGARIDEVKEELKRCKQALKRYEGSTQTATELAVKHGEAVARPKDQVLTHSELTNKKLETLNQELGQLKAEQSQYTANERRRAALKDVASRTVPDLSQEKVKYKEMAESINGYLSQVPKWGLEIEFIQSRISSGEQLVREAKRLLANPDLGNLPSEIRATEMSIGQLESARTRLIESHTEMIEKGDYCDGCKARLGKELEKRLSEQDSSISNARSKLASLLAAKEAKIGDLKSNADLSLQNAEKSLSENRTKLVEARAAYDKAWADDQERLKKIRLLADFEKQVSAAENLTGVIEQAKKELSELPVLEDVSSQIDEWERDIVQTRTKLADISEELQQLGAQEEAEARRAQTATERLIAVAKAKVVSLALDKMLELQDNLIKKTIGAITSKANLFIKDLPAGPHKTLGEIAFRDGQIGLVRGSNFISPVAMSGTEQALVYAGIAVALAEDAPFKIVCIDEMGRMNEPTRKVATAVIRRMQELCESGVIHQFVGIDVTPDPYNSIPGVNHITV